MDTIPIGKWKGSKISEVPEDYLEWGLQNLYRLDIKISFFNELKKRGYKETHVIPSASGNQVYMTLTTRTSSGMLRSININFSPEIYKSLSEGGYDHVDIENLPVEDLSEQKSWSDLGRLVAHINPSSIMVDSVSSYYQYLGFTSGYYKSKEDLLKEVLRYGTRTWKVNPSHSASYESETEKAVLFSTQIVFLKVLYAGFTWYFRVKIEDWELTGLELEDLDLFLLQENQSQ